MSKKILTHILVYDSSQNINDLIQSIDYPENEIQVIEYKSGNISDIRNKIVDDFSSEWHLYFEQDEVLLSGWDNILNAIENKGCYNFYIQYGKFIAKSTRLWNKKLNIKFVNPVFEHLECDAKTIDVVVSAQGMNKNIGNWLKENPFLPAPNYYQSCIHLSNKQYNDFLNSSEKYLFYETKKNTSYVMTKYYRALVYLKGNDGQKALDEITECLNINANMAEFWCLLGDIMVFGKDYKQAKGFYEKALSVKRDIKDDYPIIPEMYNKYPSEKIIECENAINRTKGYLLT